MIETQDVLITPAYLDLNRLLHDSNPGYGTSGAKWAPAVDRLARETESRTILDYGCGKGTLRQILELDDRAPYSVLEYDPAIPDKNRLPGRADLVVCGDVLEHIEPDCLEGVLEHLARLTWKAALLTIATVPAKKILADGRNAHLIVQPAEWWLPKILSRWQWLRLTNFGPAFMVEALRKP